MQPNQTHKSTGCGPAHIGRIAVFVALQYIALGGAMYPATGNATGDSRPNIVVFMADDLGWNDIGYRGSTIRTPNLDRLASDAATFDQFYVFPWCAATRAAFEGGVNPSALGMRSLQHNFTAGTVLPENLTTLAGYLSDAGYQTALLGKWHLSRGFTGGPLQRGYHYAFGYLNGQIDHYTHDDQNGNESLFRNEQKIEEEGHFSDLLLQETQAFLATASAPFFLNVTFSAPHYPLQSPDEYIQQNIHIEHPHRRLYAAMVSHLDAVVGATIQQLKTLGLLENTLIVFLSDNGGDPIWLNPGNFYEGQHGPYEVMADNSPLRGSKSDAYEGGIRVPAFIHWPGKIPARELSSVSTVLDLLPTLLEFAGLPATARDGTSLKPWLLGGAPPDRSGKAFFWLSSSVNIPLGGGDQDAVRLGDWKLVETQRRFRWLPWRFHWPWPRVELFDLATDPSETSNVADQHDEIVDQLRKMLAEYRETQFGRLLIN